mmetsp:Transcript_32427/g.107202  ORF Transcript_32427/g.107202 Transcript_32427/m.107202 type:complete len:200 (-) Transcript_32427:556-1155(-)
MHHALRLVDGCRDVARGDHRDDVSLGLSRRLELRRRGDVGQREREVGLREAADAAPHERADALARQAEVAVARECGLMLCDRAAQLGRAARCKRLRQLRVGRHAGLDVALDRKRSVLWLRRLLSGGEERREDALLVRLDHRRVHDVRGRGVAQGEVPHRVAEAVEAAAGQPGVVVVEQQVARSNARLLLGHLEQVGRVE